MLAAAETTETESREQTIQRALADLRSERSSDRKRAVLILGKYSTAQARTALADALDDAAADVRRNALVSMVEQEWFPRRHAAALLNLLADPDVHIRRIASSALPRMRALIAAALAVQPSPRKERLQDTVRKAFLDTDPTVRKNMIEYARLFPGMPDRATVKTLLKDDREEIRVKAVQAASRTLSPEQFAEVAQAAVEDSSTDVRLRLAQELGRRLSQTAAPLLERLMRDSDTSVAAAAAASLARSSKPLPPAVVGRCLEASDVDATLKTRLLFAIRSHAEPGNDYDRLLQSSCRASNPRVRAAALNIRSLVVQQKQGLADALVFLQDDAERVRSTALRIIERSKPVEPDTVRAVARNSRAEVRRHAVRLTRSIPAPQAAELLFDLLLDEDESVRVAAIAEFARRSLPGVYDILGQSLDDGSPAIRRAAVRGCLQLGDKKAASILEAHAEDSGDPAVKRAANQLRVRLRRSRKSTP